MSDFFEQELRKLFGDGAVIEAPRFAGQVCLGTLGKDLRARAQFVTSGYADHYDTLKITVLNRTDGPVDVLTLKLKDLLGVKPVPNNPNFRDGVAPHIWVCDGKAEWYAYRPTQSDYKAIRQAAEQYLNVFRDRPQELTQDGPKLVYICAPLRGDVEKNIEFARQKAQDVFQTGNIPVCPHLMFPPSSVQSPLVSVSTYGENCARSLAPPLPVEPASLGFNWSPENPVQDQTAREMGLRLVESCQQVNVYGSEWTEGMWTEICHAMDLGIEVKTDQKTIGRSQLQQKAPRKGKGAR
jgi:hypothetical protein